MAEGGLNGVSDPVGESRRLWSALSPRPGASYREMGLRHLRMPGGLSPLRLVREIGRQQNPEFNVPAAKMYVAAILAMRGLSSLKPENLAPSRSMRVEW